MDMSTIEPDILPIPIGESTFVSQANCGPFTHAGSIRYAYDLSLEIGRSITASRGGVVIELRESEPDGESTAINAANFRTYIADAELRLGEPRLAVLPLPVHDERWRPEGLRRGISAPLLRGDSRPRPLVVSHPLPPRPRGSS